MPKTRRNRALEAIVARNRPVIRRMACYASNSVFTIEDAEQELICGIIQRADKDSSFLNWPESEQDRFVYKIVHDLHVDIIRHYTRKKDIPKLRELEPIDFDQPTYPTHHSFTSTSVSESPDRSVEEASEIREFLYKIDLFEESYPGISGAIRGLIDPSPQMLEAYDRYLAKNKYAPKPEGNFIPPYVFARLAGITEAKLRSYQLVAGRVLADMDVSRANHFYRKLLNV